MINLHYEKTIFLILSFFLKKKSAISQILQNEKNSLNKTSLEITARS